jgi:hypothetical protein
MKLEELSADLLTTFRTIRLSRNSLGSHECSLDRLRLDLKFDT